MQNKDQKVTQQYRATKRQTLILNPFFFFFFILFLITVMVGAHFTAMKALNLLSLNETLNATW